MPNPAAEAKKAEGNNFFKKGDYKQAIPFYTQAIEIDPSMHTYYSNRSACYAGLLDWENAAKDGESCIRVNKQFIKGYYRAAIAFKSLERWEKAVETIKMGLGIDPSNQDLKSIQRECEEESRKLRVKNLITLAKKQMDAKDYGDAVKTIDQGLRLDGGNSELTALMNQAKPQFERMEKSRQAGLSKTELLKEEGDGHYKAARFEDACASYTKCLDALGDNTCELALKCFSNRSACYKQISNFDGVCSDCSMVLDVDHENVKALIRRAQACEAIEKYSIALQDVRAVLQLPYDKVGQANYQLANGMQHRLNRVVQQLKEMRKKGNA